MSKRVSSTIENVNVKRAMNGYVISRGKAGPDQLLWVAMSDEELHEVLVAVLAGIPVSRNDPPEQITADDPKLLESE